jgi:hypothetical protein
LKLFHGEGGALIDRTSGRDFSTKAVCATANSLSPFVLAQNLAPTAAHVSVSGRVLTENGNGIRSVRVTLAGGSLTSPRQTLTSSFGYFTFDDIEAGHTYIITVSAKRFTFAQPTQAVSVLDNVTDIAFVAQPQK